MKIAVAGTGYFGFSMATLLAQHRSVVAVDMIEEKVEKINRRESPIRDEYIEKFLLRKSWIWWRLDYITLNVPPRAFSNVPLQIWSL